MMMITESLKSFSNDVKDNLSMRRHSLIANSKEALHVDPVWRKEDRIHFGRCGAGDETNPKLHEAHFSLMTYTGKNEMNLSLSECYDCAERINMARDKPE